MRLGSPARGGRGSGEENRTFVTEPPRGRIDSQDRDLALSVNPWDSAIETAKFDASRQESLPPLKITIEMKAYTTLGDGIPALKLIELPVPVPGRGEILVKMTAASLNYRDLLVFNGPARWKPHSPRIPASDGVVVATGEWVSRFRTGDRVAGIFLPNWLDGECTAEKAAGGLCGAAVDGVLAEYRLFASAS